MLFYYTAFMGREQEENGQEKPPLPKGGFKTQPPHARVCMGRLAYFRTILVLLFLHVGSHTQAQQGGDGDNGNLKTLADICGAERVFLTIDGDSNGFVCHNGKLAETVGIDEGDGLDDAVLGFRLGLIIVDNAVLLNTKRRLAPGNAFLYNGYKNQGAFCMKKICRWACRHRAGLLALAAGFAAWGLFYIARRSTAAMDWWLAYVSMPVKRGLSFIVDQLPFSACELGATVLIVGALVLLARAVRRRRLAAWALHMAVLLVWGYVGVCALWGTQYYGTNFAARAGMTAPPVSTGELAAVTDYFADKVNAAAPLVQRDESGVFATDKTEIFAGCAHLYDPLTERWPFLAGPERRPKPAIYSKLMSAWGFTGYLCPLVGESTLNVDSPAVFLPVTIAHELAHQRGVAAEQEANFVGAMAATASANADYVYSGWLFGYLHLSNALYEADPALAAASYQTLCAEARADLAANNAYWKQWEGPVKQTGEKVYTTFLQGYGQDLGMRSYGACVDLLVEEFLTNTTSCD